MHASSLEKIVIALARFRIDYPEEAIFQTFHAAEAGDDRSFFLGTPRGRHIPPEADADTATAWVGGYEHGWERGWRFRFFKTI